MTKITINFDDGTEREYDLGQSIDDSLLHGHNVSVHFCHPHTAELFEVRVGEYIVPDPKLERAEQLLRLMYDNVSKSHQVNQHNPYTWSELNRGLMIRLKEFM